jgi:hypothetical protein
VKTSIPWLRIATESVVIVGSILLAFAIDAAWQENQDRRKEGAALSSLASEFTENRQRLMDSRNAHLRARDDAVGMLRAIANRGDPPGTYELSDSLLLRQGFVESFDPARGALTSLLNSGGLLLISDDSLRMALSAWPDALEDLALSEAMLREVSMNSVVPILHEYVPYASIDFRGGADGFESESRFPADYRGLLESLPFENWLDLQIVRFNRLLEDYDRRLAEADWVLRRLSLAGM